MSRKSSLWILVCSLVLVALLMTGVAWQQDSPAATQNPEQQLGVMVQVYQRIADDYVTTPNLAKVSEGGLSGLVSSLDADSSYLDANEYRAFLADQKTPPAGTVEAVFSKRVGYADVVDVQPGGNAAQAGLVRGDFVEAIENQGTRDLSLEQIRRMLEGAPGTTVTLSVVHLHHSDPAKVVITRVAPTAVPLQASVDAGVGVIHVPNFDSGRAAQVAAAVRRLRAQGAHSFVLDLRNCAAGSYTEAENTANLFLDHGTITYLQGQKYPRVTTTAEAARAVDTKDPLEVLVNFGTYGPAEVAAAALQQNQRAKLIGDDTFGEGSLQQLIPVGDGTALWLSVARYYSPNGKLIQDGLTPDVQQVQYAGALPSMDFPPEGVTTPLPDLQMQRALTMAKAATAAE